MEEQLLSFSNVSQLEEHCYEFHRRTQKFWKTPEWKRDDWLTYCQPERKRQMDRVVTSWSGEMLARVKLHRNSYIWLLFLLFGREWWHTKSSLLLLLLFLFLGCRGWCRWFRFLRRFFNRWTNLKRIQKYSVTRNLLSFAHDVSSFLSPFISLCISLFAQVFCFPFFASVCIYLVTLKHLLHVQSQ